MTDTCINRDYDIHGPAGPTAFWKESDDLEEMNYSTFLSFLMQTLLKVPSSAPCCL